MSQSVSTSDALDELRALAATINARNRDLTEQEADDIADRFVRDVVDDMIAEGKVKFDAGDA